MADSEKGKPITVRPDAATYDAITRAAERKGMSRGEWLLATAQQRLHGGAYPPPRKARTDRDNGAVRAATSAQAKAGVKPILKGGRGA